MPGWVWLLIGIVLGGVGVMIWGFVWVLRNNPWGQ